MMLQLPSSCIRRAIVMAAKLEAAVSNREKNRLQLKCSKETVPNSEAEEAQENVSTPLYHPGDGGIEGLEELANNYTNVFSNLNLALLEDDDDMEKNFQFFMHAKSLAVELINR